MKKTEIKETGHNSYTVWTAHRVTHVKPTIVGSFDVDGTRMYKDDNARDHVADTFDLVWGHSDPAAILPKGKSRYQRITKRKGR